MRDDASRLLSQIAREDTLIAVVDSDPSDPDTINVDLAYDLNLVEAMAVAAVLIRNIQTQAAEDLGSCEACAAIHQRTILALSALDSQPSPIPAAEVTYQ